MPYHRDIFNTVPQTNGVIAQAARDFGVTAFTTEHWKESFEWAKQFRGFVLTP